MAEQSNIKIQVELEGLEKAQGQIREMAESLRELEERLRFAERIQEIQGREAMRAMADMISGQIAKGIAEKQADQVLDQVRGIIAEYEGRR